MELDQRGTSVPLSNSSSEAAYQFVQDPIAISAHLQLTTLNSQPRSHEDALHQLSIAKQYIQRAQEEEAKSAPSKKVGVLSISDERQPLKLGHITTSDGNTFATEEDDSEPAHHVHEEMSPETYYQTPWWRLLLKRLPWLIALLLLQSVGATLLNHYNKLIKDHLVLNFFIPMMQGTSGNAGNQPGVMVTRALGMGQLKLPLLILKEGPVAIIIAASLAVVAYLRIRLVYTDDPGSALSISFAMFIAIILAVTLSITFSIVLHRITCCDPADGAVPLLSTVSDVLSILILMAIAEKILPRPTDQ